MSSALFVQPRDLHTWWAFAQRGLKAIVRKTRPEWFVEDVYASLASGRAFLTIGLCDATPIGFTVCYWNELPYSNAKELFIWCAWTLPLRERHGLPVDAAVRQVLAELIALARSQGAAHVACISPRTGFDGFAAALGFALYHKTFRLAI